MLPYLHLAALACFLTFVASQGNITNLEEAKKLINEYNTKMSKALHELALKSWQWQSNLDGNNQKQLIEQDVKVAKLKREMRDRALTFNATGFTPDIQRHIDKIKDIGVAAQTNQTAFKRLATVLARMNALYNDNGFIVGRRSYVSSDPGIRYSLSFPGEYHRFATASLSPWNKIGKKMRTLFTEYVKLSNDAVKILGYNDLGAYWRSHYGIDVQGEMKRLYKEIRPLYVQLHTYVRTRLVQFWTGTPFPKEGQIPESVLGGVVGDTWTGVYSKVRPFRKPIELNFKDILVKKNYTVQKIFKTAEGFLTSLGFGNMPQSFWNNSIIERPYGSSMDCNPSAWDFYNRKDFRVMMCTEVNERDFMSAHHELSHVAYFMAYKNRRFLDRDPHPAIHEAIADLSGLSVSTREHLKKLDLITDVPTNAEYSINFLMYKALQTVAYIPFTYFVDAWRWSVFSGNTTEDIYMKDWFRYRCELTGISALPSWIEEDFYAGLLRQLSANIPLDRYFFSFFLQFQFHRMACHQANHTGLLHRCDISNSTLAGKTLKKIMQLGSSMPWPELLKEMTGQKKISSKPLLQYFQPLLRFLKKNNGKARAWKVTSC